MLTENEIAKLWSERVSPPKVDLLWVFPSRSSSSTIVQFRILVSSTTHPARYLMAPQEKEVPNHDDIENPTVRAGEE